MKGKIVETLLNSRFLVENSTMSRFTSQLFLIASLIQSYRFILSIIETDYHYQNIKNVVGWLSPTKMIHAMGFTNYPLIYMILSALVLIIIVVDYIYMYINRKFPVTKAHLLTKKANLSAFQQFFSFFNGSVFILFIYGFVLEIAISTLTCKNRVLLSDFRISTYFNDVKDVCSDRLFTFMNVLCITAAVLAFFHSILIALFNSPQRFLTHNKLAINSKRLAMLIVVEKTCYAFGGLMFESQIWLKLLFQLIILLIEGAKILNFSHETLFSDVTVSKVYLKNGIFLLIVIICSFFSQILTFQSTFSPHFKIYIRLLILLSSYLIGFILCKRLETRIINGLLLNKDDKQRCNSVMYLYQCVLGFDADNGKMVNKHTDENFSIIVTLIKDHIMNCQKLGCVCISVRNFEIVYDAVMKSDIDFGIESNQNDFYTHLLFMREFVIDELSNQINNYSERKKSTMSLLVFYVFECRNLYKACELLKALKTMNLSYMEKFELYHIRRAFDRYFNFDLHHKYNKIEYLIVEKFIKLSKSYTAIQQGFIHILRKYHTVILALVI